jgi:phosphate transport system permease protein
MKEDRVAPLKDIDRLKKRSRSRRNIVEKGGSLTLATSGLVGLFFLLVLVWQIALPTFIEGETGEIYASSEFIPVSEYIMEWDHPNVDENGAIVTEVITLELTWEENGKEQNQDIEIRILPERGIVNDVYINASTGVSTDVLEVSKKAKFHIYSTLDVPINVEQTTGPVPKADAKGQPLVSSFVVSADVHLLADDEGIVFEPLELLAWASLFTTTAVLTFPKPFALKQVQRVKGKEKPVKYLFLALAAATLVAGAFSFSAILGALSFLIASTSLLRTHEGLHRLLGQGRTIADTDRLIHSITNRDGVLMWSRMVLFVATLFIPFAIEIPFLTERYQDIFQPYASGIRSAFFGTVWVMTIAMIVSIPVSIGAAIYLEEYAAPTRTTKLIQALVTNLAGVPSIVFGMFGLAIFVKQGGIGMGLGPSILAAGLTMGVMAMPIIVLASQEALRSVPQSLRESAYGVGCTRWQVVKDHVLPSAMPGIMTGSILAMSRIMGEAAPLVVVGAAALVLFDPEPLAGLTGGNVNFTVIPIQIYFWTSEPDHAWHSMAAAASIALIVLLVAMNSIAIILRQHFRRRLNQ